MDHIVSTMETVTATQQLARVVREAMEQGKFSMRGMARAAPMPYVTLSRRLAGASPFTMSELIAIATVLGTRASYLMRAAERAA